MATRKIPTIYTDIDLKFSPHPVTRDVSRKTNASAITQSIKNLVMIAEEELLWEPNIGGNINRALFKINDPLFRYNLQSKIATTIKNHEPRCDLRAVQVLEQSSNMKAVRVRIEFFMGNIETPFVEEIDLFRTR